MRRPGGDILRAMGTEATEADAIVVGAGLAGLVATWSWSRRASG